MDPIYDPTIIPTLYSKIGALTVRNEMLAAHNQELLEEIRRLHHERDNPEMPIVDDPRAEGPENDSSEPGATVDEDRILA